MGQKTGISKTEKNEQTKHMKTGGKVSDLQKSIKSIEKIDF